MILGSKKRCFFLLCGIGSLLLLSSCGKVNYSHEALLDALNAFAEERSGDAGSRFSQILNRINALEGALDKKLEDVNDRARYIIGLTDKWESFSEVHLPRLQDMAENLDKHRGNFDTLIEALGNVEGYRALSGAIKEFNGVVNDTMRSTALRNLETLSKTLANLSPDAVVNLGVELENLIAGVKRAIIDGNGRETVVERIEKLSTSLGMLGDLAKNVSRAVGEAERSQDGLQKQLDDFTKRLERIEKYAEEVEKRTKEAREIYLELTALRFIIQSLKKTLSGIDEGRDPDSVSMP